jgi:transcriptional regulator of acetoin/glycerol metabolism
VFEGWLRSRKLGVDPYLERAPIVLSGSALTKELEQKKDLLSVAVPVMEDIYSVVRGSSFSVWLSNGKGIILEGIADPDAYELCATDNLVPGADWSEKKVGNNAIGTALFLKRPVHLVQAEHYRKKAHRGYCSAAPIWGPDGKIMGALNVTGFWHEANQHTMGMVVAGVGAIQREFRLNILHQKLSVSHQYIMEMIESLPVGIIVVNQEGIITDINRRACRMLMSPAEDFINQNVFVALNGADCLKKTLKTGKDIEESEYYFENGKKKAHFIFNSRSIITSEGNIDGAVVILNKIEAVRRRTSKMAGFTAKFTFENIIGKDPLFRKVISHAEAAAATPSNVFILGESGTGKEVLAQAIHNASPRSNDPFVAINCGALPRELIGSELFGYEEGAFTGAKKGGSPGKFELANNGTLFLDEIGDMPLDLQLLLLRVLQERVIVRLGGRQEIPVDVRIIAATNKDIRELVKQKLFRQDLYYRLNVISLILPPLRERKEDIAILAKYFLQMQNLKLEKEITGISPDLLAKMKQYSWPGNIRELQNMIERAAIFENSSLLQDKMEHLGIPLNISNEDTSIRNYKPAKKGPGFKTLKSIERELLEETFHEFNGNITKASKTLGISRVTMYKKLKDYGIY